MTDYQCTINGSALHRPCIPTMVLHALHEATLSGKVHNARAIIMDEPLAVHDADAVGNLAIHYAARRGSASFLSMLVAAAPSTVGSVNAQGETPLHIAARYGNIAGIKTLGAADPSQALVKSACGNTPLHFAAACERVNGGDAFATLYGMSALPCHDANTDNNTPLHLAANSGNVCAVSLLCEEAPLTLVAINADNKIPLQLAMEK